jgi:uncharacterized damage-inducible protein DinB
MTTTTNPTTNPSTDPSTLARLASARADLIFSVLGLEGAALSSVPVGGDWTAKDMLAHVAAWEAWTVGRLEMALSGRAGEMVGVEAETENPRIHAERKDWPLCRALAELARTHAGLLTVLAEANEEALEHRYAAPWGKVRPNRWLEMLMEHDQEHTASVLGWRKAAGLEEQRLGPGCVLLAALAAAREELLAWAALLPQDQRETGAVCGVWTLRDMLGHVTDWELCVLDCLTDSAAGRVAGLAYGEEEEWNTFHAAARQGQSWEVIWADLTATRRQLNAAVSALDDADLVRPVPSVWDPQDTAYAWVRMCANHDREHAAGLRRRMTGEGSEG